MTRLKLEKRLRRHKKVRAKIFGTAEKPRLSVFRSNKYIYAQVIDDEKGKTLFYIDTRKEKNSPGLIQAKLVGVKIGQESVKKGIKKVVFDRGGYLYAGRVKSFALGAREGGLEF